MLYTRIDAVQAQGNESCSQSILITLGPFWVWGSSINASRTVHELFPSAQGVDSECYWKAFTWGLASLLKWFQKFPKTSFLPPQWQHSLGLDWAVLMPHIWLFHLLTSAERYLQKEQAHIHPICPDLMENLILTSDSLCFPLFLLGRIFPIPRYVGVGCKACAEVWAPRADFQFLLP